MKNRFEHLTHSFLYHIQTHTTAAHRETTTHKTMDDWGGGGNQSPQGKPAHAPHMANPEIVLCAR